MGYPILQVTADDSAYLLTGKVNPAFIGRVLVERAIVRRACSALIEGGFTLRLNDGEEWSSPIDSTPEQVMGALMATEEEVLHVYHTPGGKRTAFGWVKFIYGNDGWDVIANNTVNLEGELKAVSEFAITLESGAVFLWPGDLPQPNIGGKIPLDADGWSLYRSKADREDVAKIISEEVDKILSKPLQDGDEPLDAIFHVLESYSAFGANDTEGRDVARKLVAERFGPQHAGAALDAAKKFATGFNDANLGS